VFGPSAQSLFWKAKIGAGGGGERAGIGDLVAICNAQICRGSAAPGSISAACDFDLGAAAQSVLRLASFKVWSSDHPGMTTHQEDPSMRVLQPAEWSKPRGFSHGVVVDGPGQWIVLAGQTGGDEKGDYPADMAGQVAVALKRIMKLLAEAGAGPQHIVRLTWYLTSRAEYEAAGAGIGAAWKETLARNFPPSTLLYIDGLVDIRAKVEIEVTAFVPAA
jgi:enamine deaminase RidA (YjgF/YER057c/UK114 family)